MVTPVPFKFMVKAAQGTEEDSEEDRHWQLIPLTKKDYKGPISVPRGGVILGGSAQRSLPLRKPKSGILPQLIPIQITRPLPGHIDTLGSHMPPPWIRQDVLEQQ